MHQLSRSDQVAVEHNRRGTRIVMMAATTLTVVLALIAASCGSDGADPPVASATSAELFTQNCSSCHGSDLGGTANGPPLLSVVYEPGHHGDESFRSAIANGTTQHHWSFGDMPAVEGLATNEVDAIIDYVRSEQDRQGFEPYPP